MVTIFGRTIRIGRRQKTTVTEVEPTKIVSTGGSLLGDTPSGYVSELPQGVGSTPGTTTVSYSGGGGGSSSRTITSPTGQVSTQTPAQAKTGATTPTPKAKDTTIAGQLSTNNNVQPNTFSAYNPYQTVKGLSLGQATMISLQTIKSNIFNRKDKTNGDDGRKGFSQYTEPFKNVYYGKSKYEQETNILNPQGSGTYSSSDVPPLPSGLGITSTTTPASSSPFITTTFQSVQERNELMRTLELGKGSYESKAETAQAKAQERINAGEDYDVVSAGYSKELDKINVDYSKQQEKVYQQYPDVQGLSGRKNILAPTSTALDVGVGVGAGLLAVPTGGTSLVAGATYFGVKGGSKLIETPSTKDVFTDLRITSSEIQEGKTRDELSVSPLYQEYKTKRIEGAIDVGVGVAGGGVVVRGIEKKIVASEIKALGKQVIKADSIVVQNIGSGNVLLKGSQSLGGLNREITIGGKIYQQGGKSFIMPTGKGTAFTTGTTDWGLSTGSKTYVGFAEEFSIGSKGTTFGLGKGGYLTFSKDSYVPGFRFGGLSNKPMTSENLLSKYGLRYGGKDVSQKSLVISKKVAQQDGKELFVFAGGEIESLAVPMEIKPLISGRQIVFKTGKEGDTFFEKETADIITGGGKKSKQGLFDFFKSDKKDNIKDTLQITEPKPKPITFTDTSSSKGGGGITANTILAPSEYAGTGMYERTAGESVSGLFVAGKGSSTVIGRDITASKIGLISPASLIKVGGEQRLRKDVILGGVLSPSNRIDNVLINNKILVGGGGSGISTAVVTAQSQIPKQKVKPILAPVITPAIKPANIPKTKIPKGNFFGLPPFSIPTFPKIKSKPSKKPMIRKQPLRYQSSLTASVLGIKGKSQYLGKGLGYNPFQIRGLESKDLLKPIKKKKKKKKN